MLLWLAYTVAVIIVIVILTFVFGALFGRGEELPPLPATSDIISHNRASIDRGDITALRFDTALRGYNQQQVDDALAYLLKQQQKNRLDLEDTK
ncbi:DivIVA domain-containing protein [Corynebacterium sp.]|uniref:DivIVA domain-containing protein n=1 Tax=Corynebacterium sp. TaxID=1720 RepID=UPI0026DAFBA5|nr:DivIVA domain-containing protein [Corynebacterium sp.]MDO5076491.1 DivIVA domain-containing protein [Corynebacterium sp.]